MFSRFYSSTNDLIIGNIINKILNITNNIIINDNIKKDLKNIEELIEYLKKQGFFKEFTEAIYINKSELQNKKETYDTI